MLLFERRSEPTLKGSGFNTKDEYSCSEKYSKPHKVGNRIKAK